MFFFQAEDGIRDLVRSRGLGDVYKRQENYISLGSTERPYISGRSVVISDTAYFKLIKYNICLLYTSDAADERSSVDLGGRRIIKKKSKIVDRGDRSTKKQKE